MSGPERQVEEESFAEYRDRHNNETGEMAFLRSLGITKEQDDGKEKTKTVRERVAEKIAGVFQTIDAALNAHGIKDTDTITLRELLEKDLSPFMRKDKPVLSMMDRTTLGLVEENEIRRFLLKHGFNIDDDADLKKVLDTFKASVAFYDSQIALDIHPKIHQKLRKFSSPADIYHLFQTSAGHGIRHLTPQACALLRIGMVRDFMNKDFLISRVPKVQGEFKNVVHRHVRKVGNTYFYHSGDPSEKAIPLIFAEARTKNEDRITMKLLQKASNSTSEVLDHIGFRFETESASDALRLIYQMFFGKTAVLPSMYIRINQTKQNLVHPDILMAALKDADKSQELFAQLSEDTINHQDVENEPLAGTENVHSSPKYRAIHIIVDFPVPDENPYLFPIEIQFVSIDAKRVNDKHAPHDEYEEKQRVAVTGRILDNNLQTNYQNRKKRGGAKKKHG